MSERAEWKQEPCFLCTKEFRDCALLNLFMGGGGQRQGAATFSSQRRRGVGLSIRQEKYRLMVQREQYSQD